MRVRLACSVLLLGVVVGGSDVLRACGDKLMPVGRGIRFQIAYAAIHPASILILVPPKSVKGAALRDSRLVTGLKLAGHRPEIVQLPAALSSVLTSKPFDIVLVEEADAPMVPAVTAEGQVKPTVIPVLENPPADVLAAAQRQNEAVLRTPESLSRILGVLDDVMEKRIEAARGVTVH